MSLDIFFWVIYIVWFALGAWAYRDNFAAGAPGLLLAGIIFMLGWKVFGFIIK